MFISIDTEKAIAQIQHFFFLGKAMKSLRIEGTDLGIIKAIYSNPVSNIVPNAKPKKKPHKTLSIST